MAGDIEVELPARDLIQVDVGEQDLLAVAGGSGENLTERADDAAAAGAEDVIGRLRERVGNVVSGSRRGG